MHPRSMPTCTPLHGAARSLVVAVALAIALPSLGPASVARAQSTPGSAPPAGPRLSNAEVVRTLIRESIEAYDGNCPCPYHRDRRGRACGRRSAWSREGGEAPLCYPRDVTPEAIAAWRAAHEAPGS